MTPVAQPLRFEELWIPASEFADAPTPSYKLCLVLAGSAELSYRVDDRSQCLCRLAQWTLWTWPDGVGWVMGRRERVRLDRIPDDRAFESNHRRGARLGGVARSWRNRTHLRAAPPS